MAKVSDVLSAKMVLRHCEQLGLDRKALAACLAVNPKTIERWQEGVEPNESALRFLEKLESMYQLAAALLKQEHWKSWFQSPNGSLGGERPVDLLRQGEIDRVRNVLGMLEWGIYS